MSSATRRALAATGLWLLTACSAQNGAELTASRSSERPTSTATSSGDATDRARKLRELDAKADALAHEVARARDDVTPDDVALVRAFIRLAVQPSGATASRLPWSRAVRLGVGDRLSDELDRKDASQPSAWVLDLPSWGGVTGPFSALDTVRSHAETTGSESVGGPGAVFDASVGRHPRCAGGPATADLSGLVVSRRVSLQPSSSSTESCLDWFSVDLLLDPSGQIQAVLLDVWEP